MSLLSCPHHCSKLTARPMSQYQSSRHISSLSVTPRPAAALPRSCRPHHRTHRHVPALQATSDREEPQAVLEAFFYGRAFVTVFTRRTSEAFYDAVAEVSKAMAERPDKIKEFQQEVVELARKEMYGANAPAMELGSGTSAGASSSTPAADMHAAVDDLRAEIASSRVVLTQIRQSQSKS